MKLIKRETFVSIGTFASFIAYDAIQEDKALGALIKKGGYNMKLVARRNGIHFMLLRSKSTLA